MTPTAALAIDPNVWGSIPVGPKVAPTVEFAPLRRDKRPALDNLGPKECIDLFGKYNAVAMNFIPMMITALAVEEAEALMQYCSDNRLPEFKRHSRSLRECIAGYKADLRKDYGRGHRTYTSYLNRLRNYVASDVFQAWCTFTNEASRQLPDHPHREIPARVAFARMLLTFVEDLDREVLKMVSNAVGGKLHRRPNGYIVGLSCLLIDIAESFGAKLDRTYNMGLCVKVLANRCKTIVRCIIEEEDGKEANK